MTQKQDNYQVQAAQARQHFLTYDQSALIAKLGLTADADWLYTRMLGKEYRLHRREGSVQRLDSSWAETTNFNEVMTLLDLVCDSREDRFLSGELKPMQSFGLQFHSGLLEDQKNPWAQRFDAAPEVLAEACRKLGGRKLPMGDIGYAIPLFDGLEIGLCFWAGDDEFPPQIRYFWDANAKMYIKYETMYFAVGLLLSRIAQAARLEDDPSRSVSWT